MSAKARKKAVDALAQAADADDLRELLAHCHARRDDERRALSRQLHDSLGSSLTALSMHLGLLTRQMPADSHLQERTAQMQHLLHKVIETNRQIQTRLWNHQLEFSGLSSTLTGIVIEFGQRHHLALRCSIPELACPESHALALLLTLEEGLSNIAAHAQARSVDVTLSSDDAGISLKLHDDGVGFRNPTAVLSGKHGLRALRERITCLGGKLTLSSDHGSTLTVLLPKPVDQTALM